MVSFSVHPPHQIHVGLCSISHYIHKFLILVHESLLLQFIFTGNTSFNEKPYFEQKKCFSAKYVGWTEVDKSSGTVLSLSMFVSITAGFRRIEV